jgi:hypothetical protein
LAKILKDQEGKPFKRKLLGGRAEIVLYDDRAGVWTYRQLIPGTKKYFHQSTGEYVEEYAIKKAEDLYLERQACFDENGSPTVAAIPIDELLRGWVRLNEDKQRLGEIKQGTLSGKTSSLLGPIRTYLLKEKGLKTIGEIKLDTFLEYRQWRVTKGWQEVRSTRSEGPPKDSTVKRDFTHLKDWFANFLIPRGYTNVTPTLPTITIRKDQLDSNPPIPLKPDWEYVYRHLESWSNDGERHTNPRVHYWRMCFRHFVLICYNAGTRPSELVGTVEKRRQIQRDGTARIVQEVSGLRWEDVEVYEATHLSRDGKPFTTLEATLHIRKTKTGEPREVPCNTGTFFKRWREFVNQWRVENGFDPVTPKDYVFFYPYTQRPYSYSQWSKTWDELREALGSKLSPVRSDQKYTLYSLRSSYITNQIEEGKDVYLIKQLTGHSLEILNRHYDRSQIKSRRAEATARTYGKREENLKRVDLQNLNAPAQEPEQQQEVHTREDLINQIGVDVEQLVELRSLPAGTIQKLLDDGVIREEDVHRPSANSQS